MQFGGDRWYTDSFLELVITGWGGVADPSSGITQLSKCTQCNRTVYSCFKHPEFLVDCSRWDGSDFFRIWPLPRHHFVSGRVAEAIRAVQVDGIVLLAPQDLICEGVLCSEELSFYMPLRTSATDQRTV